MRNEKSRECHIWIETDSKVVLRDGKQSLCLKSYRYWDKSEDGLTFAFRFTDATVSSQGRNRKGQNVQEGYGSTSVLPEQGIYLAASIYRPVVQFTDRPTLMMPQKYSQLRNDGFVTPRKISSNNVLTRVIRFRYVKVYFKGTKSDKR
ncbi:hypothetical protein HanXRQr2_Chr11g0517001 [Helianthus annuus]|uniref:Exocyst complex component Sec8 n=1 Tax=Helianthus annuus TaxID=4232 RepID=A0A9K3N232_HELAN|nr:hypothetical protein HanXRQr2_Chr11g0517001 [Helianthus annuus]KAJ0511775.1 putative exocyst complex component Sec8/EXOC4 [Helianthus annuus]KAJ0877290.1 hypothetical protein HanPSC8_Chr11g0498371 [Helianthus annuus]